MFEVSSPVLEVTEVAALTCLEDLSREVNVLLEVTSPVLVVTEVTALTCLGDLGEFLDTDLF